MDENIPQPPASNYGSYGPPSQPSPSPRGVDANLWNIFSTLGPIILGFIAPLLTYLLIEDKDPKVKEVARVALNGQISYTIYMLASTLLMLVLIGFILFPVVVAMYYVFIIVQTLKISKGELWAYPLDLNLIK